VNPTCASIGYGVGGAFVNMAMNACRSLESRAFVDHFELLPTSIKAIIIRVPSSLFVPVETPVTNKM
jgi:hypothetical protein